MAKRRNPNAGLFNGYWLDANGKRTRRLARNEYPALYELWRKHRDIRMGVTIVGMHNNYGQEA